MILITIKIKGDSNQAVVMRTGPATAREKAMALKYVAAIHGVGRKEHLKKKKAAKPAKKR